MQKFMQKAKKFMQTHKKLCGVYSNSKVILIKKDDARDAAKIFSFQAESFFLSSKRQVVRCNRFAVEVGASKLANTFENALICPVSCVFDAANVANKLP